MTARPRPTSIAKASEADLANIIYIFGEERYSRAVAKAIVAARKEAPIDDHQGAGRHRLARWCGRSRVKSIRRPARSRRLRIFVNAELDELHLALAAAERVLKPGGRLVVVSFHSLEDRIVKNFLGERGKAGGGSRHLPEVTQAAPSFRHSDQTSGHGREATRSPPIRARGRPSCARPSAPQAPAHAAATLPAWPVLDDVMRGG